MTDSQWTSFKGNRQRGRRCICERESAVGRTSCFILVNKLEDWTFQAGNIKNLILQKSSKTITITRAYILINFFLTLSYFINLFLSNFLRMPHVYKLHIVSNALFIYNFLMILFIPDKQYMWLKYSTFCTKYMFFYLCLEDLLQYN